MKQLPRDINSGKQTHCSRVMLCLASLVSRSLHPVVVVKLN